MLLVSTSQKMQPCERPASVCSSHHPRRCTSIFNRFRFHPTRIVRQLKRLCHAKGTGPEGIPASLLKHCATILFSPLFHQFLLCACHGILSLMWKTANFVQLHIRSNTAQPHEETNEIARSHQVAECNVESDEGSCQHCHYELLAGATPAFRAAIWLSASFQRDLPPRMFESPTCTCTSMRVALGDCCCRHCL